MRISSLFDQGSSAVIEDGHFEKPPFFGVTDGYSEPYCRLHPHKKFRGRMSGGELISRLTEQFFAERALDEDALNFDLRKLVTELNIIIRAEFRENNFPIDDAGQIPSAFFAIARVNREEGIVEVVQTGDCLTLWIEKDGKIGITQDQNRRHVDARYKEILLLQQRIAAEKYGVALEEVSPEDHREIITDMWIQFHPILEEARRKDTNNPASPAGFGALNGQPELEKMLFYQKLPMEKITDLVLLTDGLVPPLGTREKARGELSQKLARIYKEGGIFKLYEEAVKIEKSTEKINYTVGEKTAVAIKLSD